VKTPRFSRVNKKAKKNRENTPIFSGKQKSRKNREKPPILKVYFKINIFKEKHPDFQGSTEKRSPFNTQLLFKEKHPDFQGWFKSLKF
jgi:hypothetical protein